MQEGAQSGRHKMTQVSWEDWVSTQFLLHWAHVTESVSVRGQLINWEFSKLTVVENMLFSKGQ